MQKILLLLCLICGSFSSFSQKDALIKFEKERISISKRSMLVLGGWSAANIIVSAFGTNTGNREMRYFHQMNIMWNGINLAIAGLGYRGTTREKINNSTLSGVLQHQSRTEKTYIFNTALDLAYMAGGFYLKERSKSQKDPAKLEGYGNSIILQAGFLLLYDAVNYAIHRKHGKQLDKMIEKLQVSGGPRTVSLAYSF
ncbi:MAG TPA: hypothetical protein VK489_08590 [Ferruginibacter sp.]|nr:hypothetical protein [Ferruginibacter sp.]